MSKKTSFYDRFIPQESKRRIVHNSKEFLDELKKSKPNRTIIYDEAGFIPFNPFKRNFVSPNKVQIPIEIIIELGFLRKKNLCAKCGKKMDIPDYHIQLCRNCREVEFEKVYKDSLKEYKGKNMWF